MNIKDFENNDNCIVNIQKENLEYIFTIKKWDSTTCIVKTAGCKSMSIVEDIPMEEFSFEIGSIIIDGSMYMFEDAWDGDVCLSVIADDLELLSM